ncbi:hypothetical protein GCM10010168_15340 [Actinoplanes ianthinogenes]|uniref:Uncharacterized protein n=1 Tax=Actinoplanes ianthinogenes TaxID=122358 RepID=A0ABN6CIP7_9ACTN|nr:hypothetical protein [Actinoplanes ianthinogenes]BCJ44721.1 hypothetical protein Aiant_53780 [Actinoplanes ianthinogenes]GGQ99580.1 hypothetical protein GCM10010168_15340 [Actinoplanes ianthinogenes]
MVDDLGAVLRQEAERHVPDGEAMFDRINRQRFAAAPVRASRPFLRLTGFRPVAAAASVVATLVAGFTGMRILTADEPDRTPTATTGTASVAPTTRPPLPTGIPSSPAGKPKHTGGTATPHAGRTTATPATPSHQPISGFVSTTGVINSHSTPTWAQSDVTLTAAKQVTALDLAISVARTDGLRSTGRWSTIPAEMMTITVTEEKDALIYRFTLRPGGTLAAGSYVFAAQYEHASGKRALGADLYGAFVSAGDQKVEVTGAFTAS